MKLNQQDMARELKISRVHLGNVERNKVHPSIELLERIEKALGMRLVITFVEC